MNLRFPLPLQARTQGLAIFAAFSWLNCHLQAIKTKVKHFSFHLPLQAQTQTLGLLKRPPIFKTVVRWQTSQ